MSVHLGEKCGPAEIYAAVNDIFTYCTLAPKAKAVRRTWLAALMTLNIFVSHVKLSARYAQVSRWRRTRTKRAVPHPPVHAGSRVLCPAVLCALLVQQTLSTDDIKVISNRA